MITKTLWIVVLTEMSLNVKYLRRLVIQGDFIDICIFQFNFQFNLLISKSFDFTKITKYIYFLRISLSRALQQSILINRKFQLARRFKKTLEEKDKKNLHPIANN